MDSCKICSAQTTLLFTATVLYKYEVNYFQCPECRFIQTEKPYWLNEAYNKAITRLDIGLISRNKTYADRIEGFFQKNLITSDGIYLDYGGGYGMFVRMMRDKGYNFFRQDIYCDNLFAENFDLTDFTDATHFDLLTAFEIFEHLEDPLTEIQQMLSYSHCILFSTLLQPNNIADVKSWWYVVPETGQHIALYDIETLKLIAKKFDLILYSNNLDVHILSKSHLSYDPFEEKKPTLLAKLFKLFISPQKVQRKESLLQRDFEYIKNKAGL